MCELNFTSVRRSVGNLGRIGRSISEREREPMSFFLRKIRKKGQKERRKSGIPFLSVRVREIGERLTYRGYRRRKIVRTF